MFSIYQDSLNQLQALGRLRQLSPRDGLDFSSNDYIALADDPRLKAAITEALDRGVAVGSSGSRLLRGNDPELEVLEAEAATYFGAEAALFYGSGFMANYAILTGLPQKGDMIVLDELIHASSHDGARASRADHTTARHSDLQAFEDAIKKWRASGGVGRIWIVVESLYSMDGDRAPLKDLMALADRHSAMLLIDEAHATGVFGPGGRGLSAPYEGRENVIALHTCGKALGASGALVCGPKILCDFLINRSRPFIYATAPSPLMAAAVRESLRILAQEPWRREKLAALVAQMGQGVARLGGVASGSQIQPIVIGDPARTMALAAALQKRGFDIRGVRPPTVPEGTSRLRVSVTLHANSQTIKTMLNALQEEQEQLGG